MTRSEIQKGSEREQQNNKKIKQSYMIMNDQQ